MITISGLTARQKQIMSLLWSCETMDQAQAFIAALPTARDVMDAHSLVNIAQWESLEQDGYLTQFEEQALEVIDRIR
jgi:hypothetical protein